MTKTLADQANDRPIALLDIEEAQVRLASHIYPTPLLENRTLSARCRCNLFLKAEHLQRTGSFKVRGALNRLLRMEVPQRARGVVAFSSGNHAQGVALAASLTKTTAHIVMPTDAPKVKVAATREYGAQVVFYDRRVDDRQAIAQALTEKLGATLVPPFDDPWVMAGQGTLGVEILSECPQVDTIIVPVGGGGLISGIAVAVKSLQSRVRLVGVEPAVAADALMSRRAGHIVQIAQPQTIADGAATQQLGKMTFPVMQDLVDSLVTVTEQQIARALLLILHRTKQLIEPTAALGVAALLSGQVSGKNVVAVLSGGNLDLTDLPYLVALAGQDPVSGT